VGGSDRALAGEVGLDPDVSVGHRLARPLPRPRPRRNTICSMSYWTDIFTLETRAQAAARGFSVSGFPPPTAGKAGYSIGMFERVRPGDVFLCYCKGPASRWVGALRVTGDVFQSEEPVWGLTAEGQVRYPWRYPVEPVVTVDPVAGSSDASEAKSAGRGTGAHPARRSSDPARRECQGDRGRRGGGRTSDPYGDPGEAARHRPVRGLRRLGRRSRHLLERPAARRGLPTRPAGLSQRSRRAASCGTST
jgi:hypothetical protein